MKKNLYAHIVLDRSGSMETDRDATIGAVNEYANGLGMDDKVDARISLTIFDSQSIDLIRDNIPAAEFEKLTRETYQPRGGTPLNDAIGRTVAKIDVETRREDEGIVLVIVTDGQENASNEYTKDAVKKLLEGRQKDKSWLVLFLGADINVFDEGVIGRGTVQGHTLAFNKSNVQASMRAASRSSVAYAMAGNTATMDSYFTDAERDESIAPEPKPVPPNPKVKDALEKSRAI